MGSAHVSTCVSSPGKSDESNSPPAVALMLVEMERSYISAGFFRSTMYRRTNKIKEQEAMIAAGQKSTAKGVPAAGGGAAAGGPKGKSYFPAFGGKEPEPAPAAANAPAAGGDADDGSDDGKPAACELIRSHGTKGSLRVGPRGKKRWIQSSYVKTTVLNS